MHRLHAGLAVSGQLHHFVGKAVDAHPPIKERRQRLAEMVADAEQVLVTAAVPADVPEALDGTRIHVAEGVVSSDA